MTAQTIITPETPYAGRTLRYPCSPIQHRFWVLNQLEPGDSSLNVAIRWRIEGTLEHAELEQAFRLIVQRHEVLRTYFTQQQGEPVQMVQPHVALPVAQIDLRHLPREEAEAEAERCAAIEARKPFQLAMAPLMRVTQVRITDQHAVILLTAHHIICDGWSIGLLAREMGEICDALHSGREPQLPKLPVSYGDYAAWMLEWLDGDELQDEQRYWQPQLRDANYFELPTDQPRPPVWRNDSAIVSRLLPRAMTDKLAQQALHHGCTLYMLAMAGLATLLHRYSGESDISIGTQVAGRSEVETEDLLGVFINTLVMRHDLSGDPGFPELLLRVRKVISDAIDHEFMPIEKLIELLKPKRDTSRNPLFSVNFIFQRSFIEDRSYSQFRLIDLPSHAAGALYDLNFYMVERPDGWRFSCEYNASLFNGSSVERLLLHLENLFTALAEKPNQRLSQLPLMAADETRTLLALNNATEQEYPREHTLVDLFRQQVKHSPEATAVVCSHQQLTYQELDSRSDRLAHTLHARGWAGAGQRVGVFFNRSTDLLVALLAVMKSGSAYVPLDPHYPQARIAHICNDAEMAGILTNRALGTLLAETGVEYWTADEELSAEGSKVPALPEGPGTEDSAYVIYTSGSTGLPKGVEIGHRALTNFLCSMQQQPGLTAEDTLLAVTTISFDIAALELYLPLICGAKVVIAREEEVVDGHALEELIDDQQVSVLQATPVTWRLLLEAGWQPRPKLKMLCGGEALPRALADQLLQNNASLWNLYGPTETTIWSAALQVQPGSGPVPIGAPIANTQFYILDEQQQPVPQGMPGELYIGGDGVAKGYFRHDELNAERFIADPFSESDNRLYRTGDRIRLRPDGSYEYLGRTDFQVKLRGYRIELGEIDAVLQGHPQVRDAVCVLGENSSGDAVIWGYVVPQESDDPELLLSELRQSLSDRLPAYMHPSSLTLLDAMPQTPNGKTDRKALPTPQQVEVQQSSEPLDEWELVLADLWRELLDWEGPINPDSNFFELGGHSITAARLLARIESDSGRHITLAQLFHSPTLRGLAELMRPRTQYEDDFRQVVRLQSHGSHPPLIALHNTGTYFSVSRQLGGDYPFISLQLFDPDYPTDQLPETLEEVAAGYVQLIRNVQPQGPYHLVGWCLIGVLSYEVARQLREAGAEVSLVVLDGWAPGHSSGMPSLKRKLMNQYYRVLVAMEASKQALRGEVKLGHWLQKRINIRKNKARQRALLQSAYNHRSVSVEERPEAMESYGQWLFAYLDRLTQQYEMKPYPGEVLVLRSACEPRSRFLDWQMGWGQFAESVKVDVIDGDHWSMLQDPGAAQIAQHLKQVIATDHTENTQ